MKRPGKDSAIRVNGKTMICFHRLSRLLKVLPVLFFCSSCVAPVSVYIDVLKPSLLQQKYQIDSIAVVDNGAGWSAFILNDTLVMPIPAGQIVQTLSQKMADSGEFPYVMKVDSARIKSDSMQIASLPDSLVERICSDLGVRSLLTVDLACVRIPLITTTGSSAVSPSASYALYQSGHKGGPVEQFFVNDLYYYPGTSIKEEVLAEDAVECVSDMMVGRLTSGWTSVTRAIFTSLSSDLRYGYLAYSAGKYDEALSLWTETAENAWWPKIRAAAYLNSALVYEMSDAFSEALQCMEKAGYALGNKDYGNMREYMESYRQILVERQQNALQTRQ